MNWAKISDTFYVNLDKYERIYVSSCPTEINGKFAIEGLETCPIREWRIFKVFESKQEAIDFLDGLMENSKKSS